MATAEDIERLEDIFYTEAPHDYVLSVSARKKKYFLGSCSYEGKICYLYGPDDYWDGLHTLLHEIAHARIQHKTHSNMWEQEFVRLLVKYDYPRVLGVSVAAGDAYLKWKRGEI